MPVQATSPIALSSETLRRYRWRDKQLSAGKCSLCADPVARICLTEGCKRRRKATTQEACPACGKDTTPTKRLCCTHLKMDRERKAA